MNMDPLKSMSPCEVVVLGLLIALSICDDLSTAELNVLGNMISAIGSIVSTWAAQQQLLEEACESAVSLKEIESRLEKLEKECGTQPGNREFPGIR